VADRDRPKLVYLPTSTLLGFLATVVSWLLVLQSVVTKKGLSRRLLFVAVALLATVFIQTVGRRAARGKWPLQPGQRIALSGWQVAWVTILALAGGALFYWLSYH
jgi:hypothetical protein